MAAAGHLKISVRHIPLQRKGDQVRVAMVIVMCFDTHCHKNIEISKGELK